MNSWVVIFKQKTAYEMRISDWSSDVCASELVTNQAPSTSLQSEMGSQRDRKESFTAGFSPTTILPVDGRRRSSPPRRDHFLPRPRPRCATRIPDWRLRPAHPSGARNCSRPPVHNTRVRSDERREGKECVST